MQKHKAITLKVKRTVLGAKLPTYASDGASAFDFYAAETKRIEGCTEKISLGVAVEVPKGWVLLIMPRSSIGANTPLRMANSVGVIDSDYRGTIHALYEVPMTDTHIINEGERIAQGMLVPAPRVNIKEVETLSMTDRGVNGFGSTGR